MVTQLITLEIPFQGSVREMQRSIASALKKYGDPLRWAITAVDRDRQVVQLEAVVTKATVEFHIPNPAVRTV